MKLFIVIVAYKGHEDVISCVLSIKELSYQPECIIVVDNASPDSTGEKLSTASEKYAYTFIGAEINGGFAAGCNIGIKKAFELGATHIGLINPDTLIRDANFFLHIQEAFNQRDFGIIGTYVQNYQTKKIEFGGGKINHPFFFPSVSHMGQDFSPRSHLQIREVDYTTGSSLFFSRKTWDSIGSIDESYFLYFEETDWCMRAQSLGLKIGVISSVTLEHKTSSSVGFRSLLYTKYMICNYARFALRWASWYEIPFWFLVYIGFWVPGQLVSYFYRKIF